MVKLYDSLSAGRRGAFYGYFGQVQPARAQLGPPVNGRYMQQFANFEILGDLGHGGMGKVYKVRNTKSGQLLALKLIHTKIAKDPRAVDRFVKEAQAATRLSHPNIVKTYGAGSENSTLYIGMELIEGVNLYDWLQERGPMRLRKSLRIARQVCDALAYSHGRGIIHRDIKPHNILMDNRGKAKVLDFGMAKTMWDFELPEGDLRDEKGNVKLSLGQRLGTPLYMPPEQMRGDPIDARADIYALGATLYEMLTGVRAFDNGDIEMLLEQKQAGVVDYPELLSAHAPVEVASLIERMLRPRRDTRPRSASGVHHELDDILVSLNPLARIARGTAQLFGRD